MSQVRHQKSAIRDPHSAIDTIENLESNYRTKRRTPNIERRIDPSPPELARRKANLAALISQSVMTIAGQE
jgi:hypothetical protein